MAEALNLVDDQRPERRQAAYTLLTTLESELPAPGAMRVGLTGPPGAGKSTLLDALVPALRARDATLGILAVDPSSRVSGGALLGDRFRVRAGAGDPGVFLRSMAARTRLGGLADATRASATILAAVFDWVVVETVGIGQSESDVASLVDHLVYVAQPGSGDTLQFMKAGVLEHPDVFVVGKADAGPEAKRTASDLEAGVGLGTRETQGWTPPVILVSARTGTGIQALLRALVAHRRHLETTHGLMPRRRKGLQRAALETLHQRYGSFGIEQLGGPAALAQRIHDEDPAHFFDLILRLGSEIEAASTRRG